MINDVNFMGWTYNAYSFSGPLSKNYLIYRSESHG
jgi:hypothetical protein